MGDGDFPQLGTEKWGWGQGYTLKRGSGDGDGVRTDPYPGLHPRSGIDLYPHPRWGQGFFPDTRQGPDGSGDSSPHCHP